MGIILSINDHPDQWDIKDQGDSLYRNDGVAFWCSSDSVRVFEDWRLGDQIGNDNCSILIYGKHNSTALRETLATAVLKNAVVKQLPVKQVICRNIQRKLSIDKV